jgi:general secretion pathway protein G
MAPPLTSTAGSRPQSSLRPWITFALLTVVLTGAGLALIYLVRPSALQGMFSRSNPVEVRRGQALNNLKWIHDALLVYAHEHKGEYPARLDALVVPGASGQTYFGDRREVPLDPWNRPFVYAPPTPAHPQARITSLGADGKPGGQGEDADIDSDTLQLEH